LTATITFVLYVLQSSPYESQDMEETARPAIIEPVFHPGTFESRIENFSERRLTAGKQCLNRGVSSGDDFRTAPEGVRRKYLAGAG